MLPEGDHLSEDVNMLQNGILILIFCAAKGGAAYGKTFPFCVRVAKGGAGGNFAQTPHFGSFLGLHSVEQRQQH